jgi:hypothetical protein
MPTPLSVQPLYCGWNLLSLSFSYQSMVNNLHNEQLSKRTQFAMKKTLIKQNER